VGVEKRNAFSENSSPLCVVNHENDKPLKFVEKNVDKMII
jgi:hypothetical protein